MKLFVRKENHKQISRVKLDRAYLDKVQILGVPRTLIHFLLNFDQMEIFPEVQHGGHTVVMRVNCDAS